MRSYLSLILVLLAGLFVIAGLSGCAPTETEVVQGPPGLPGDAGPRGPAGRDGNGCHVTQIQPGTLLLFGGAIVQCGDVSVLISNGRPGFNGANGQDGTDGVDGTDGTDGQDGDDGAPGVDAITEIINPCGVQSPYDEVLLRLGNGQLLAHYSDGNKQFLTILGAGNYVTTDSFSCHFNVSSEGVVTW
jgi:hypothetical protein